METFNNAIQLMEEGRAEEALALLRTKLPASSDEDKFIMYELYYEWGFFEEATEMLEILLESYPDEGEIIIPLTEMYIELEKDDKAIHLLNQMNVDDPFYLPGLLLLADVYQAQGLFEVAEQKLFEAKRLAPDETVIDFALGEFLFSIGQANRAIPFYEKAMTDAEEFNGVDILERLAECHAALGHFEEAFHYFQKVKLENPDTLFKYGLTAKSNNRHDIAIQVWKKVIEADPTYLSVYPELAAVMKEEGMTEEAFAIAEQGLGQDEYNKELYLLAARLAIQLQHIEKGMTYLQEAIALDPDYQEAVMSLAELYQDQDQYEKAVELITYVKAAGANDPLYDWQLAKGYVELEQFNEALEAYEKANEHLSHQSAFLKEFGYFLTEEGMFQKALIILGKYLEIEPLDEEVHAFIERLNDSKEG